MEYISLQDDIIMVIRKAWRAKDRQHNLGFELPEQELTGYHARIVLTESLQTSPVHYEDTVHIQIWCAEADGRAKAFRAGREMYSFLMELPLLPGRVTQVEPLSAVVPGVDPITGIPMASITVAITTNGERIAAQH